MLLLLKRLGDPHRARCHPVPFPLSRWGAGPSGTPGVRLMTWTTTST